VQLGDVETLPRELIEFELGDPGLDPDRRFT
jgi:hypothetical protein